MKLTRCAAALFFVCVLLLAGTALAEVIESVAIGRPAKPAPSAMPSAAPGAANVAAASPHVLKLTKVALASFSPDGKLLMTIGEEDKQIHLWNVDNGIEVNRFGDAVTHAIFSGSGARVMSWGEDGVTRIFDTRSGKALRRLEGAGETIGAGAISSDGSRALTCGSGEKIIKIWDAAGGKMLGTLEGNTPEVTGLAFSPDGRQAVSLSEMLRLWDLEGRKIVKEIQIPPQSQTPYFSANGKLVLVVGSGAARIYDLATGEQIAAARTPEERFSAGMLTGDRKTGMSRSIGAAAIINAVDGQKIRSLEGPIDGMPICNAFSDDGARVILGTGKIGFFSRNPNGPGKVYVYEVASGKRLAMFEGHGAEVMQVSFSADANHAFSRDGEKTLFLWAIK